MTRLTEIGATLRERFPEVVLDVDEGLDMGVVTVDPSAVVDVLVALRDGLAFDLLADLSAVDWLPREPRYDVNYHLYSLIHNDRLRVKAQLADSESLHLPSVTPAWPAADWHEREVFDFFGIVFDGHPNLKRILMPDEWVGYPLRKDYPVGGVPVEYRIEPAYVGPNIVPQRAQPSAGGVPVRLRRDRGRPSHWTWTGPPASGMPERGRAEEVPMPDEDDQA